MKFSYGELQAIRDEVIALHAKGGRDAGLIYGTSEDHRGNRVVIWVKEPSEALFKELAVRFGTEAIAVAVDAESFGGSTASRQADGVPYYGGASINGGSCSDSFSWTISGTKGDAMLTAAHCAPNGGDIKILTTTIGTVTGVSGENWSTTTGTTYYSNQSTYYGDVALIRLKSTLSSDRRIYRGGVNSNTSSPVIGKRTRYSVYNDLVFVGGRATGETGQYKVVDVHADWWYSQAGPNVWVRNNTRAGRAEGPPCAAQGDSGGSVFVSPVSPSGVTAAGTFSGFWGISSCNIVFTDIWATYVALPGDIWR